MEIFVLLGFGIIFLLIYFFPALIANYNNHPQLIAIFILNFLLGWTLLGWVAALVWACIKSEEKQVKLQEPIINNSIADEIKKLADLKEQGFLTEEEFNAKKKQILNL